MKLTDKLHLIATIASNLPYVGLLGTVLIHLPPWGRKAS
jgi:biopolymer transport protein ExbB/TolQ